MALKIIIHQVPDDSQLFSFSSSSQFPIHFFCLSFQSLELFTGAWSAFLNDLSLCVSPGQAVLDIYVLLTELCEIRDNNMALFLYKICHDLQALSMAIKIASPLQFYWNIFVPSLISGCHLCMKWKAILQTPSHSLAFFYDRSQLMDIFNLSTLTTTTKQMHVGMDHCLALQIPPLHPNSALITQLEPLIKQSTKKANFTSRSCSQNSASKSTKIYEPRVDHSKTTLKIQKIMQKLAPYNQALAIRVSLLTCDPKVRSMDISHCTLVRSLSDLQRSRFKTKDTSLFIRSEYPHLLPVLQSHLQDAYADTIELLPPNSSFVLSINRTYYIADLPSSAHGNVVPFKPLPLQLIDSHPNVSCMDLSASFFEPTSHPLNPQVEHCSLNSPIDSEKQRKNGNPILPSAIASLSIESLPRKTSSAGALSHQVLGLPINLPQSSAYQTELLIYFRTKGYCKKYWDIISSMNATL